MPSFSEVEAAAGSRGFSTAFMEPIISPARDSELEECARVIRESFSGIALEFGITMENNPNHGAFVTADDIVARRRGGAFQFVYRTPHGIVGFAEIRDAGSGCFDLARLCVLPDKRHLGAGAALLAYACEKARSMGGSIIKLSIIDENARLRNWYETQGFVHITSKDVGLPFIAGYLEKKLD